MVAGTVMRTNSINWSLGTTRLALSKVPADCHVTPPRTNPIPSRVRNNLSDLALLPLSGDRSVRCWIRSLQVLTCRANMGEQHGGCRFWPRSKKPLHRFTDPFNATFANHVLAVSNLVETVTPAISGRQMDQLWGNMSNHTVQEAAGDSYLLLRHIDVKRLLAAYFNYGAIPESEDGEVFCGVKKRESYFPPKGEYRPCVMI